MVDSSHSRRDHGKKRHHYQKAELEDNTADMYSDRSSKRTSDHFLSSSKEDESHRSHHHKSKRHKHDRNEDRDIRSKHRRRDSSKDRSQPKDRSEPKDRTETHHHPIQIREEPVSPKPYENNLKNRDSRKGKQKLGTYSPSSNNKFEWGKKTEEQNDKPPVEKEKPNFALSGKLTEDRNMYNGVVIKYSEPPEARKPKRRWRLYPFKGDEALPMMHIHRQSAFLIGRDRKVVDIPIDHPSCSKQHAALQYRLVQYQREDGSTGKRIRLYIIDLESANGTYVNNNKIEPRKYVELMETDVIKFGYSSREYVLLHEGS